MARLSVMGIFTAWRIGSQVRPSTLASPWSTGQLSEFVMSDVFGDLDELPLTRAAAMRVPAVAKGRNLIVSAVANLPLVQLTIDGRVPNQPGWMSKTRGISTWQRMAWTVDDLIFYGASLWEVERGADGSILTADRVPIELWTVTDGAILVDGEPRDETQVLYIPGPHEGILTLASGTIRGGRDLESAWQSRVKQPIPATELRETMEAQLSPTEVQGVLDAWSKARKSPNGAVGYVPYGYELHDHGSTDAALFEDGRNAVRTDIGAHLNIDASLLDAAVQQSSLTYKTAAGERSAFLTYGVPFWTNPIETRLSMDDVVPRGSRTRLDMSELLAATATPTGIPTED